MKSKPRPLLVAIVGGSGAGKSWLAEKLQTRLGKKAARLSLDDFYRDRANLPAGRRAKLNFDHPRAIDWGSVERALGELLAGTNARVPRYDFKTHTRLHGPRILKPRPIMLVDGLWLLRRPSIRRLFGLRIFLDCPTHTRLRRRLARDQRGRGRSAASVREQFWKTVEPMHRKYVVPQKRWAEVVLKEDCGEADVERLIVQLRALVESRG
jgi:uridine kinase